MTIPISIYATARIFIVKLFLSVVVFWASAVVTLAQDGLTEEQMIGSASRADTDKDGISNLEDVCPSVFDPSQSDQDNDGVGDACDMCVSTAAPGYMTGCLE